MQQCKENKKIETWQFFTLRLSSLKENGSFENQLNRHPSFFEALLKERFFLSLDNLPFAGDQKEYRILSSLSVLTYCLDRT